MADATAPLAPRAQTPALLLKQRLWRAGQRWLISLAALGSGWATAAEDISIGQGRAEAVQAKATSAASPVPLNRHEDPGEDLELARILREHWQPTAKDPKTLAMDIDAMEVYFNRFPEVRDLLASLRGKNWRLQFAEGMSATEVRGSKVNVSRVTIYFDPRAAAQYKFHNACSHKRRFCVATPADVLLHELLHAHIALVDPARFISDGGFNTTLYPHRHERRVIEQENELYAAMSRLDDRPRPQRREHHGRMVEVACVTCLD